MARINLLPWREWERERRKQEFIRNAIIVIVSVGAIVFGIGKFVDGDIDDQNARNRFLQARITELDAKIAEIQSLKRDRENLLSRMRVIQELQGNRPVIVRVFDEMVRSLAGGVYYSSVELSGQTLSMTGIAESNNRISSQMRNLDGSDWFTEPNLKTIKENPSAGPQASTFQLSVKQTNPRKDTDREN